MTIALGLYNTKKIISCINCWGLAFSYLSAYYTLKQDKCLIVFLTASFKLCPLVLELNLLKRLIDLDITIVSVCVALRVKLWYYWQINTLFENPECELPQHENLA